MLQCCRTAKEMGSRRPVTMREEADNLVLNKQEALAAIKRRRAHLRFRIKIRFS